MSYKFYFFGFPNTTVLGLFELSYSSWVHCNLSVSSVNAFNSISSFYAGAAIGMNVCMFLLMNEWFIFNQFLK